jgi:hypothetical protein
VREVPKAPRLSGATKLLIGSAAGEALGIAGNVAVNMALGEGASTSGGMLEALPSLVFLGSAFVGIAGALIWIYGACSRANALGGSQSNDRIPPWSAVGRFFIPFYNLYWLFQVETQLCHVIEGQLQRRGLGNRGLRSLAIKCGIMQLIPFVDFLLAPFAWSVYAAEVDGALHDLESTDAQERRQLRELDNERKPSAVFPKR